jgi:bifunctional non-homologous end joining protein LigD
VPARRPVAVVPGEPLPDHVPPMLAVAGPMPTDQERWGFELKWDGVRVLGRAAADGGVRLESRSLRDVSTAYPELRALGPALAAAGAVVDGEVVALDDDGRPDFQRLQERMHVADARTAAERAARVPVLYIVFDVLQVGGGAVVDRTYEARRALLEDLGLQGPAWATPPWFPGEGDLTFQVARDRRLEGVIAKRLGTPYVPGARSPSWRKVKIFEREDFVVGGWMPGEGGRSGRIGSLLVGRYDEDGVLRYAGGVGTGFTGAELDRLAGLLAPARRATSPFTGAQPRRGAVFVEPRHVAEIEFRERTRDGILRQPSFKGLRDDTSPTDVVGGPRVEVDGDT